MSLKEGEVKLIEMLQCVLCMESSIASPYLIAQDRGRKSVRFVRSERSASPPAILSQAILWWGGSQGGSSMETVPAVNHFNELQAPSSPILLLLPSPSLPNPYSQHKSHSESTCLRNQGRSNVQGRQRHPRKLFEEALCSVAQPRTRVSNSFSPGSIPASGLPSKGQM